MRILIAPDKFKGSLGARAVAQNIALGLAEALPDAEITLLPIADGGEGTAEAICAAAGGQWHECEAHDAYGEMVSASFATIDGEETAVLETSAAIGLWRIPPGERGPTRASSYGAGELLLQAARTGARKLVVGLGGSATNDGGFGFARVLGFRFFDRDDEELAGPVLELLRLARVERPPSLDLPAITIAADVRNPLLGEHGATRIFGFQKGAYRDQLDFLEAAMTRLADVVARDLGVDHRSVPGAGAAGGLGFGLLTFASATMRPGFEVVAECINLEAAVRNADVVITGEGRLDEQTLDGKAPAGVALLARRCGVRCFAIVGQLDETPEICRLFEGISVLGSTAETGGTETALREKAREFGEALRR